MAFDVVGANNLPLMYSVSRYCVYVRETNRKTRRDEIRDLKVGLRQVQAYSLLILDVISKKHEI